MPDKSIDDLIKEIEAKAKLKSMYHSPDDTVIYSSREKEDAKGPSIEDILRKYDSANPNTPSPSAAEVNINKTDILESAIETNRDSDITGAPVFDQTTWQHNSVHHKETKLPDFSEQVPYETAKPNSSWQFEPAPKQSETFPWQSNGFQKKPEANIGAYEFPPKTEQKTSFTDNVFQFSSSAQLEKEQKEQPLNKTAEQLIPKQERNPFEPGLEMPDAAPPLLDIDNPTADIDFEIDSYGDDDSETLPNYGIGIKKGMHIENAFGNGVDIANAHPAEPTPASPDIIYSVKEKETVASAKPPKKSKSVLRVFSNVIFYTAIVFILLSAFFYSTGDGRSNNILGYTYFTVLTKSMQSEIPKGSLVIVQETDQADIQVGDDITFRKDATTFVTHRVTKIFDNYDSEGNFGFETQGIENARPDFDIVHSANVVGVVKATIPALGDTLKYIKENPLIIFIVFGSLIMMSFFIKGFFKEKRKNSPGENNNASNKSSKVNVNKNFA